MLLKLREFWGYFVAGLGALIGFLVYYLTLKNREIDALKSAIDVAATEKQVDIVETEIKEVRAMKKRIKKEEQEFDKALEKVEKRRQEIKKEVKEMSTSELIDHLNKD